MLKLRWVPLGILFAAACQGPFGLGGPPSAHDIANKPAQSSMADGHFNVQAVIVNGATHTNGSGDGVLVLKGKKGLKLNVQVSAGLINVGVDLIAVGGKEYERVGNGPWTVTDDSATPSDSAHGTPSYIGESQIGSDKAWHIRSKLAETIYDEWVRESDGYLLKYSWQSSTGSFTMNFDQFNIGADIVAPSKKEMAASQYQALVDPLNTRVSSVDSAIGIDINTGNLSSYKTDMSRFVDLEQQFLDGLAKIDFPTEMQGDVNAVVRAEKDLMSVAQQAAQASSWEQVNALNGAFTAAGNADTSAVTKLRADLGLPPPSG